jgi:hypothetical protein
VPALLLSGAPRTVAAPLFGDPLPVASQSAPIPIDVAIASSADDAEQWQDGTVNLTSTDLELVDDGGRGNQIVGIRFAGLAIPDGATITDAWIQFTVDEASSGAVSLRIEAQDVDSAPAFTAVAGSISARSRTAASVSWTPPAWPTVAVAGLDQRTPSLVALVQAVIDRPGWSSGNAMAFIITGSGTRWAGAFDGGAADAPRLHLAYTTTAADPPTISAVAPTSGPVGTVVAIDGTNFVGTSAVTFNGSSASFTVVSATRISATVPASATSGPVAVAAAGGSASRPIFTVTEPPVDAAIDVPADYPTIQAAIDAARDGDLVVVAPGTYRESVVIDGKQITLGSRFVNGGDATLVESTVIDTDGIGPAITVRNVSAPGPRIVGLKLVDRTGATVDGILAQASARIHDNHIVGFEDGIDIVPGALGATCSCLRNLIDLGGDDGIDINGASRGVFDDNVLRSRGQDGIEIRLSDDATPLGIQIRGNEISGNAQDGIQIIDEIGASDRVFTIERNRIVGNGRAGIGLMDGGSTNEDYRAASLTDRIYLFNNTISGNNHGVSGGDNVVAVNNIVANSSNVGVKGVDGGSVIAHSLFWSNATSALTSNLDASTTIFADPLFASDHSLGAGSPAIDSGVAQYTWQGQVVLDRPASAYTGTAPDLGALESGSLGPPPVAPPAFTAPAEGGAITTRTFTVRGSSESGARVRLIVDGTERATTVASGLGEWATVVNGLADGSHTLTAVAVDAVGNQSPPSPPRSISVALVPGDPIIAAAGDIACDHVGSSSCQQVGTSDLLLAGAYDAVLPLGDTQYECGSTTEFAMGYEPSWGRLKPITRPIVGNHEYFTTGGVDCDTTGSAAGYFGYFGPAAGSAGQGWYSYDLGAWHLVALNSNCAKVGGCGTGSPQEQWLRQDLAASTAQCTLAYWHHPRWSSGGRHGSDASTDALVAALHERGAEIILSGNDHDYERFAPQAPDGTPDPSFGMRQFVIGTGGHSLVPFGTALPNSEARLDTNFGVLQLTLGEGSYGWAFVSTAGSQLDGGSGSCHGTPGIGDTTPPQTTISSGPLDPSTIGDAEFSFGSSESASTFECALDAAAFTGCASPLSFIALGDGQHTFAVRATDAAGNTDPTPAIWTWTIDTSLPPPPITATFIAQADAHVRQATPTTNYGSALTLTSDGSDGGGATESLMRFDVSGLSGQVQRAVLRVWVTNRTTAGPDVYRSDSGWSESLVTWSNRPVRIGLAAASSGAIATGWYEVDVTSSILGNGTFSFTLAPRSSDGLDISSREGSTPPRLVVTYGGQGDPDTTPPETTITSGPSGTTSSTTASFSFDSTEPGTFACSLDGAAFGACTSPATYTGLAPGGHTFAVRATDGAGNADPSPASRAWTIAAVGSATFRAVADSYIDQQRPTSTFGSSTALEADSDAGRAKHAVLRFEVTGLSAPVVSARIRLWVTNSTVDGPRIQRCAEAWSETSVTWATQPALIGAALSDAGAVASGGWREFDVTSAVTGNGTYSFILVGTSNDGMKFASRETSTPPELVLLLGS